MNHIALGPGREFDLVRALLERWGPLASGVGDDAAVLEVPPGERLVVSTDSAVEDVHFRREWLDAEEVGYRAAAAALSDLAAMGAKPLGMTIALALPERWRGHALALADGIAALARETGTPIVGGDLTSGAALTIGVTVMGSAPRDRMLHRSGARPGQHVYVTGRLGGPGCAVRDLYAGTAPAPESRARYARPIPRLLEAQWLAAHGVTAAVDISDGLVADAAHLAAASGCRLSLTLDALPVLGGVTALEASGSGEEYELLVTADPSLDIAAFTHAFALPITAIGRVEAPDARGPDVVVRHHEQIITPPPGHDHFRR